MTFIFFVLCFRGLKTIIYKKVYENMEKLETYIYNMWNSKEFLKTIKYNFKETTSQYLNYYEKYNAFNFNIFKY